jgi:Arc/MetJ family transcription regulator
VSWSYDLGTDIGVCRLMLADTQQAEPILQDEEIQAFLALEGGNLKMAAAQALDAIATNEALTQKVIKVLDLTTNGAALAQTLRAHAKDLRDQVRRDLESAQAGTDFDWAEEVYGPASERERIIDQALRGVI